MLPCFHGLIVLKGLEVLDSVVHRLDLPRRDKLHPCKTSVAYDILGGGVLLRLIFALILSWGCMICDTCSVTFMVLCISHILHVESMMHDHLVCYA